MKLLKTIVGKLRVIFSLQFVQPLLANRYVGKIDQYSEISFEDIVAYAAKAANINESNIRMAMDAIFDALQYYVCEGHAVEMPYLGTFSFGINGKATYSAEDAQRAAQLVYRKKIKFLPDLSLRELINRTSIEVVVDEKGRSESTDPNITNISYFYRALRNMMSAVRYKAGEKFIISGANLAGCTLKATGYDAAGVETVQTLALTQLSKIKFESAEPAECYGFSKVEVVDTDDNVIVTYNIAKAAGEPSFSAASLAGIVLQSGITNTIPASSGTVQLILSGYKPAELETKLDNVAVVWDSVTDASCSAAVTVGANAVLKVGDVTFNIVKASTAAVINTLTANGTSVGNGGTTQVILGNTYHLVANGANLSNITSAMITAPGTISNFAATVNSINFDLIPTAEGDLSIGSLFTVTLAEAPASGIVSIGGVGNNGNVMAPASSGELTIVGAVPADATINTTGNGTFEFNADKTKINYSNVDTFGGQVNIKQGDTTIFSFSISYNSYA